MQSNYADSVRLVVQELLQRRRLVVTAFVLALLGALVIGYRTPIVYTSYTTVFLKEENILGSLLRGTAVQTESADRAAIAREMIYGRNILSRVLEHTEWGVDVADPVVREALLERIMDNTEIANVGNSLIRIQYSDVDPQRTYEVTRLLAALLIEERIKDKSRESESAFVFIDQQIHAYKEMLESLEHQLQQFRLEHVDASPGAQAEVRSRIESLRTRIEGHEQDLREARIRRDSLERQLSGEVDSATVLSRAERYRVRLGELRTELEQLRLRYHDTYPDVVAVQAQINELEQALQREAREGSGGEGRGELHSALVTSPLYQELRAQLYQTNTDIDTIQSRLEETRKLLEREMERGQQIHSVEALMADLTRDYEVTRELYQDLLRRREQARVSMSLNREQEGSTLRVDEAAFLPQRAAGPAMLSYLFAGALVGLLAPVGFLLGVQQLDPRIRLHQRLVAEQQLPVLGVVPHLATPRERRSERRHMIATGLLMLGAFVLAAVLALFVGALT